MLNSLSQFAFHIPTRIEFGPGKSGLIAELVKGLGRKALLVSSKGKSLSKQLDKCRKNLAAEGIQSVPFYEVVTNPDNKIIDRGCRQAIEEGCDFIIGFGGGSAIDVAKGIAVTAVEDVKIWEIVEGRKLTRTPLPIVAVPTTSGTGSEVTQYAVISNPEKRMKEGIGEKEFYPVLAIVDPELTKSMPPELTAAVGLDALSHAIEGYTTRFTNPITDSLAESAIRLIGRSLRPAVFNGLNISARNDMMLGSLLAGIVITHADTSLAHVVGEAVGAVFNIHHGLAVALTLPAVMEFNCHTDIEKFKKIAEFLGEETAALSDRQAAELAPSAVRELIFDVDAPRGLAALGASENDHVLKLCTRPGWDASNLRSATEKDFISLIKGSLSPEMSYWKYKELT